jgi:putative N6-adenine-specific DNA methylase
MKLNLHLRTGQRVLYFLDEFKARLPDELYARLMRVRWEDYIPAEGYLSVTSSVHTASIKDTRFANLKAKDAIVDRLMQKRGKRPDSGPARDRTVVFLHWKEEVCSVYLDTSGEPLAKRGYRQSAQEAPMQETLAAAVIMATNWNGAAHFINPMCGSGTLAIEAALLALNKAPGLLRSNFGFMHLNPFEAFAWNNLKKSARLAAKKNLACKIIATDHSEEAIQFARENAYLAGVDHMIEFRVCDFTETPIPEGDGLVMLNPEYGVRMGETKALEETYGRIGDFFKQKCLGYTGYVFTGNLELAKKIGLRTRRKIPFFNGEIECRLLEYELYEGSRQHARGTDEAPR